MNVRQYFSLSSSLRARMVALSGVSILAAATLATGSAAASSATLTTTQQQRLQTIIAKGDQEIARRLASLATLTSKINTATKLTASDKAALSNEVASTTSGLTALKAKLDAETTLTGARTDVQDIYSEYRVYALVAPKVYLIKVADDQQVVEGKLTTLAQKLQSRITAKQQAGKDVAALQEQLNDMTSKANAAQAISASIESSVIDLQPSDYNSNHSVLSGDNAQLKTAHGDNQAAYADAKSIAAALKAMK